MKTSNTAWLIALSYLFVLTLLVITYSPIERNPKLFKRALVISLTVIIICSTLPMYSYELQGLLSQEFLSTDVYIVITFTMTFMI